MSIKQTIEGTASDFMSNMAVPVAEKVRDTADEWIDRIGTESRQIGERLGAQLEHMPEAALARLNLVSARKARRNTVLGVVAGVVAGALVVKLFTGEEGARRRQAILARFGWEDPQSAAAVTGDLPK